MNELHRKVLDLDVTFNDRELMARVISLFPKRVVVKSGLVQVKGSYLPPYSVYSEIEDALFDLRSQCEDLERQVFLELLEIMSWAIFRVWNKNIKEGSSTPQEVLELYPDSEDVLRLFWENLNCEEGTMLRSRVKRSPDEQSN
ncbi:hypothetical protein [Marinobacter sp. NFXS9]|uniref:hypothetical protein n=1 Tax=Marinobacter sp. NFXS9 TaxID=2818433 RepID=UPI0032E03EBB